MYGAIQNYDAERSYSAKGNPYDNAVIHAIQKKEKFIGMPIEHLKKLI